MGNFASISLSDILYQKIMIFLYIFFLKKRSVGEDFGKDIFNRILFNNILDEI